MPESEFFSASERLDRPVPSSLVVCVRVADFGVVNGAGVLSTLGLGSCVAIMLYEARARIGGLAHTLLPHEAMSRDRDNRAKFASTAVPLLIRELRALGSSGPLTAKLVGGASMFGALMPVGGLSIGQRNVESARRALIAAGITIVAEDVGGDYGRSAFFDVATGLVTVRSLNHGERVL